MVNETSSRLKCWLFETHKKRKTPRWGGGKAHKASERFSSPSTLTTQEAAMSECWGEGSPRGDEGAAGEDTGRCAAPSAVERLQSCMHGLSLHIKPARAAPHTHPRGGSAGD